MTADEAWRAYAVEMRANHLTASEFENAEVDFKAGFNAAKGTQ